MLLLVLSSSIKERFMTETRLHPRFGIEIGARDVCDVRRLSPADLDDLRATLRQCGLLLFRDQVLTDEDLFQFSLAIGDGRLDQSADRIALSPANAAISNLTNLRDADNVALGFGRNDLDFWHSDQEYRQAPATLAALYCLIPAPVGGDTSFATTRVEPLGLSDEQLAVLRPLKSTRRPAPRHDNVEHIEVAHPLVLRNPASGAESLYISELLIRFLEIDAAQGQEIKQYLLGLVLAEENIYRHQWRFGDLLVFDNTQLTHRREAFEGNRWLKATKIFAPTDHFAVPVGDVVSRDRADHRQPQSATEVHA
jgi:taurine dioxygenase